MPRLSCLFACLAPLSFTALLVAAPAPIEPSSETVKDRKTYLPHMIFHPLPGKTIGIFVTDVASAMGQEGRSGMPDAGAFSRGLDSYNWLYVPVKDKPTIKRLPLKVGEKGETTKTFTSLSQATPETVKQFDIDVPYALVEVEVNDGLGAPADQHIVGTKMKRLDGTKEYPLVLADVVKALRDRYAKYKEDEKKNTEAALADSQKTAIKDKKPTGPRQTNEVFYITWLPDTEKVRVHFRTTISDGAYETIQLPGKGRPREIKYGTTFGIEYGAGYEVDKNGKVDRVLILPPEPFKTEIPPPSGVAPPP